MGLKWTESVDGKVRCTVHFSERLTKEEYEMLSGDWRSYIQVHINHAISELLQHANKVALYHKMPNILWRDYWGREFQDDEGNVIFHDDKMWNDWNTMVSEHYKQTDEMRDGFTKWTKIPLDDEYI